MNVEIKQNFAVQKCKKKNQFMISPFRKSKNILEKPVKTSSQNLSFTGFSYHELANKYGETFGASAKNHFLRLLENTASVKNSRLRIKPDGTIELDKINIKKGIIDTLSYPFFNIYLDFANATLKFLKKFPMLKNSKRIENIMNFSFLKKRRENLINEANVNAIEEYISMSKQGKDPFLQGHFSYDPSSGNYSTISERSLTRAVTGVVPAFFLANDAYNLSMYMNNNKDLACKEKKKRFNQEVSRIALTAGATFAILNLFKAGSNKSANMATILITGVTLLSEIIGRLMVSTPVLPVSVEKAKKYAANITKNTEASVLQNTSKPEDNKQSIHNSSNLGGNDSNNKQEKNSAMTISKVLKVIALLMVGGFAVEKITTIKSINKFLKMINDKYKALYTNDFTLTRKEFNQIMDKLKSNGFENAAKKYEALIKNQKLETINLGKFSNSRKKSVIHQLLAFPLWYSWSVLMTPYKFVLKPVIKFIKSAFRKKQPEVILEKTSKELENEAKEGLKKQNSALRNVILYMRKNANKPNLKDLLNNAYMKSFDKVTTSQYSNAELASQTRNATTTVTSGFLIVDNYNLVMINTNGSDKELAEQKAKERTIQRGIRLLYGALFIKLFNGIFSRTYNGSLLGAQAVNTLNTSIIESMERTSVGLPIGESTKQEIERIEKEHLEATGFKGAYFRMMAKLTGKKALSVKAEG